MSDGKSAGFFARSRRRFLGGIAVAVGTSLGIRRAAKGNLVRPPGAAPDFDARCIRCFRCAEVCPPRAIRFDGSLDLFGTHSPHIVAQESACTLCMKCTEVCPTDALRPLSTDLEAVHAEIAMGFAVLDRDRCITITRKGSCRLCFEVCPYAGRAVALTGLGQGPAFYPDACVGCGLCAEACPDRAKAIDIVAAARRRT